MQTTSSDTANGNIDDAIAPKGVVLRDWEDAPALRKNVFDNSKTAFASQFPQRYGGVRLEVHDLDYEGPEEYSLAEQKDALMSNKFLHRKLVGTYKLFDDKTGESLGEQRQTVMKIPYLTERGTWIHGGNEYSTINQSRLLPGAYTRRTAAGDIESHLNARRGTGNSLRIQLEPQTGVFKLNIGQANLKLYSLLHDIDVPDEQLEKTWGPELLKTNREAYDRRVFEKAYQRLVRKPVEGATHDDKAQAIREALASTKIDRAVAEKTLPNLFNRKVASVWQKQGSQLPGSVGVEASQGAAIPQSALPQNPNGEKAPEITKDDLLSIALFLNKMFTAGIPLDETVNALSADIKAVISDKLPGLNPELAAQMQSQAKVAGYSKYEIDREANRSALSDKSPQPIPTQAMLEAGNYAKGHLYIYGLDVAIENPRGSYRFGVDKDGKPWKCLMKHHYGYLRGTVASDGDQVDIFLGPDVKSRKVFVVNQVDPHNGKFDEVKCMLGFDSAEAAKAGYLANYAKGWKGFGSMVECPLSQFKKKLHLFRKKKHIEASLAVHGD